MAHRNTAIRNLADLIEQNPNCKFEIDNDMWYMMSENGETEITNSEKIEWTTNWYGHSSNYGAGIAEALIEIFNRKSFNIDASAV